MEVVDVDAEEVATVEEPMLLHWAAAAVDTAVEEEDTAVVDTVAETPTAAATRLSDLGRL